MKKSFIKILLFISLFFIIDNSKVIKADDTVYICRGTNVAIGQAKVSSCNDNYTEVNKKSGSSNVICTADIYSTIVSNAYFEGEKADYNGQSSKITYSADYNKCKEQIKKQCESDSKNNGSVKRTCDDEPLAIVTVKSSTVETPRLVEKIGGINEYVNTKTTTIRYGFAYSYSEVEYKKTSTTCGNEEIQDIYINKFYSKLGDEYYCIEPGKNGPSSSCTPYCLDTTVDLSDCVNPNDSDNFMCGVSQILMYAYEKNDDGKYVLNGNYDYAAVSTALRLWSADWSAVSNKLNGPSVGSYIGIDSMASNNSSYIKSRVYYNTVLSINNESYGGGGNCSNSGVLCGTKYSSYLDGISLYNRVKNATTYEGEIPLGKPKITYVNVEREQRIDATIVFDKTENIELHCDENDSSNCEIRVQAYQNGKEISDQVSKVVCRGKENGCTFSVSYYKICQKNTKRTKESNTVSIKVTIAGNRTLIRKYVDCNNPSNSQVMVALADEEYNKEINDKNPPVNTYSDDVTITCPCNEEKACPSEEIVTRFNGEKMVDSKLDSSCEGSNVFGSGEYDTYSASDLKDPYMNCILNACDLSQKEKFNVNKLDPEIAALVNTDVCNVYCRDEVHFYMANKTKVFSGMQFEYDIASSLISDGVIKSAVSGSHKLTSVVLQKRQCTSEIYYDVPNEKGETWLDKYKEKLTKVQDAWKNWKYYESLLAWEKRNKGPQELLSKSKNCVDTNKSSLGSCDNTGSCSINKKTSTKDVLVRTWPKGSLSGGNCDSVNVGGEVYVTYLPTIEMTKNNPTNSKQVSVSISRNEKSDAKYIDGQAQCGGGCSWTNIDCPNGCDSDSNNCVSKNVVSSIDATCNSGKSSSISSISGKEEEAYKKYISFVDDLEQWIFDLENCNLYSHDVNKGPNLFSHDKFNSLEVTESKYHENVRPAVLKNNKSIKDELLKKSACTGKNDCIELNFAYQDNNYGDDTKFNKELKVSDDNDNLTRSCYNDDDKDPNCYKYQKDTEVEINSVNKMQKFDYIYCNGETGKDAKCSVNGRNGFSDGFDLPVNDFATFTTVTQSDFWQPKKYQTEVYTGLVSEGDGSKENYVSLGNEIFPVSNNSKSGKTGIYDTIFNFKNINLIVKNDLNYKNSCAYEIYNTTRLYDCKYNTVNGNLVLEGCNPCYEIVDGVPKICDDWNKITDTKGYGFIYRNVDAANLFPLNKENNKSVGRNNWLSFGDVITDIESSANKLFVTDELLEYRFILDENAIKNIRKYNSEQIINGDGYLNNTLLDCSVKYDESGLQSFYDCKSSFIDNITNISNNFGVKAIKVKEIKNYGY